MTWPALLILAGGTYLLRLAGLALRGRLRLPDRVDHYVDLGATALLVALVATAALLDGGGSRAGPARRSRRRRARRLAAGAVRRRRGPGRGNGRGAARAGRAVTRPPRPAAYVGRPRWAPLRSVPAGA